MQKKLIAVAVAGALGVPTLVMAQSTVNIYGKITTEYGYADQGNGRPNTDIFQTPGGSAIGFKGEERVGGGMSAWFQCESSADVRGVSQDGFCSRNSALGLKGAFGNLHFGRWDTPFKRAISVGMIGAKDTGLLGSSFLLTGSSTGTIASGGQSLGRNIWKRRESSQIYYETPSFSGFQVLGAYSAANATSATNASTAAKPRVASISGLYKNGPLELGLGYERHTDFGAVAGGNDDRGWTIAGAYTFMGKVKIAAAYIDTKYETSGTTELKKKNWQVGAEWNIAGPHNLDLAYVHAGDSKGNSLTGISGGNGPLAASGPSTGAKLYEIAYRYTFSKRTNASFGYVKVDNDANSSYTLGGLGSLATKGDNQSAWVLYAEHKF